MSIVRLGVVQLASQSNDVSGNHRRVEEAIREAHERGCVLVVLPELAASGYVYASFQELLSFAEPLDGPTLRRWEQLAKELEIIIVGGFPERDGEVVYNSAAIVDKRGTRAIYRKTHLWDREKDSLFVAGDKRPPIVETDIGKLSMIVCYDLEFPELIRDVALRGADLLCAPVTWPLYPRPKGERPTEVVRVQAAASQNRMPIACADRAGWEGEQPWVGGSVVVDADGYPVTELAFETTGVFVAELDLADTQNKWISERNHVHEDRLPRLYAQLREQGQYD